MAEAEQVTEEENERHDLDDHYEDKKHKDLNHKDHRKTKHDNVTSHSDTKDKAEELRDAGEDVGPKPHLQAVTDEIGDLMMEAFEILAFDSLLAYMHAIKHRDAALEGPVKGQEYRITNEFIDQFIQYMNLALDDRKTINGLIAQMETLQDGAFGKKKGFVGKNVERAHKVADKTSRTLTKNKVKLKRKKELKG